MPNEVAGLIIEAKTAGVDKASSDLSRLSTQAGKAGKASDGMGESFDRTDKKTNTLSRSMGALVSIAALAGIGAKVIASHREFTAAISDLSAITGATGADLEFYNEQAKDIGATTTLSATQAAQAFKLIASAKPDLLSSKESLAAVTREVVALSEASGVELTAAASTVGSALNQFGADADEASRFVNVLAAGAKFGASEVTDTAEALRLAGTVAKGAGLSFEETNAAIQAMAAVSLKGSEAGTGLRGVLLKLSTQSRDEFNPEIVGFTQALQNLADANLDTTAKTKLFGLESITAANALINQADTLGGLTKQLTATNTAYDQASIRTNNLDGDVKQMDSAWEGVSLVLGDTFNPALRFTVQLMTDSAKVANTLALEIGDLGDMLGAYAAIAVSVATFDLDGASAIIDARREERKLIDEKISKIWDEKDATEQLTASIAAKQAITMEQVEEEKTSKASGAESTKVASSLAEQEALQVIADDALFLQYEREDAQLTRTREIAEEKLAIQMDYWNRLYNLETGSQQAGLDFANAIRTNDLKGALQTGALALAGAAKQSRAMFSVQKALALANAAVTLPDAIMKSFNNGGGYPWGLIPAGLMAAQGAAQISAISSSSFGGGAKSTSVGGGGGGGGAPSLPQGATATPQGLEVAAPLVTRELRVTVESDGPNSDGMRKFAENLADTIKDMGGNFNLVVS